MKIGKLHFIRKLFKWKYCMSSGVRKFEEHFSKPAHPHTVAQPHFREIEKSKNFKWNKMKSKRCKNEMIEQVYVS